jgi:predicted alpha/beta superfamily hydrolase
MTPVYSAPADPPRLDKFPAFKSQWVAAREVDVWLPPGYAAKGRQRYPVVYMHDGQNLFDPKTSYGGVPWSVDQAMIRLMNAGKVEGAIIVGIWNSPARFAEYMPQKAVRGAVSFRVPGVPDIKASDLKSDAYLQFIVRELKPFIDRAYRTKPEWTHTFIMGSSMGGLISAYAVCEYPNVFGGAACLSTHWPAGDGAVIDYLAQHLPSGAHRFYFDYGTATLDSGYEPFQRRMDTVMRAAGYVEGSWWLTRKFPGAEHSEKSWRERVDLPLAFLLGEGK